VKLDGFLRQEKGLDIPLTEQGANLSGGQRQRLALARALLHDSPVYIFDEATSNIDVESENDIMEEIHRLANVTEAKSIYVMEKGSIVERGTHQQLLEKRGAYAALWNAQQSLENYGREAI
jgi:ABC-type multidrug transport system fused ATPase/permease subunit